MTRLEHSEYERCVYIRPKLYLWPWYALLACLYSPRRYFTTFLLVAHYSRGNLPQLARNLVSFAEAAVVGTWLLRSGCHHLHTHFASFTGLLVKKLFGVELSVTLHGPAEFTDAATYHLSDLVHNACCVVTISAFGASQTMQFSSWRDWQKLRTIRLGIDLEETVFRNCDSRSQAFQVISVGRLVKVKAHAVLLQAYALLRDTLPEISLTIVGDGPEMESLKQLAEELHVNVVFTGALPNSQVQTLLSKADCFVLPSFAEGIPVVLMEAMAIGVPCVATRITGIPELIDDGINGILVAPGNTQDIADAIYRLLSNPELCSRLRISARAKIVSEYNLLNNVALLAEQLEKCSC